MRRDTPLEPARDQAAGIEVADLLRRVAWRARIGDTLAATAVGLLLIASGTLAGRIALGLAAGAAVAAALLWRRRNRWRPAAAARRLENAFPACRNLVITAEELLRYPDRVSPRMRARVLQEAAGRVRSARPAEIVSVARPLAALAAAACIVALSLAFGRAASKALRATIAGVSNAGNVAAATPLRITVTVTPPAYTGRTVHEEVNPDRIDAIEGSTVRLAASGAASAWQIRLGARTLAAERLGSATVASMVVSESGYFAIEPLGRDRTPDRGRLLPVTVIRDRAPTVRLETPGHDLVLSHARGAVAVEASATDDVGVRSLEIRYTKVSGTGEQFEFEEGTLPVALTQGSDVAWKARGQIALAALELEPGDALVYRAVARDGRPGDAGLAASDTFFIEIAGPGQVALEGFEMPPDQERYALSQQMIVLRIQRLRARERTMLRAAVAEMTAAIAAEQRAVRANFIFLMGGHVEDEEAEAEHSHEIQEGRLQNTARTDVNAAIEHMGRAEQALVGVETAGALAAAKAAVQALQRAFGRSRYILRTIATASRVDPSRRLTGELSTAGDWRRDLEPATIDRETRDARMLLSQMLEVAAKVRAGRAPDAPAFTSLSEQALAIDPGASVWQDVARRIDVARAVAVSGRDATAELSKAIGPVIARAQRAARMAQQPGTRSPGPLLGVWAKELRR